jgi:hypothetical protein
MQIYYNSKKMVFVNTYNNNTKIMFIARNDRWFAYLHIQNGGSKRIWNLTYSWTGNFLLAWAGQFSEIENQTMHRSGYEHYLSVVVVCVHKNHLLTVVIYLHLLHFLSLLLYICIYTSVLVHVSVCIILMTFPYVWINNLVLV